LTRQAEADRVVHVEPLGVAFRLAEGETLIEAAWRDGYYWPTVCGGRAECTACHVLVRAGEENAAAPEEQETAILQPVIERTRPAEPVRLACRLRVTGQVTVYKRAVRRRLT
jgi:2Fe-2S ferredoxin